jgi:two-component system chemotaxis response regulator CheY
VAVRTLLVEDSIPFRSLLKRRLEQVGCTVVGEAANASQGLELFRELRPDLVTLDLVLESNGELDSKALFRAIRQESPKSVVMVLSAHPKAHEGNDFLREGAIAYLEKNFMNVGDLLKLLGRTFPELQIDAAKSSTRRF